MASYGLTLKEAISISANLNADQKQRLYSEAADRLSQWEPDDSTPASVTAEVYRIIRFENYKEIMG